MFKKCVLVATLGLLLCFPAVSSAGLDCQKMKEFVDIMFKSANYLSASPNFDSNEELGKALEELIDALKAFSQQQDAASLANSVSNMEKIWAMEEWTDKDRADFIAAMDATNVNLKRIYEKECPQ